jgi:V/A-type H+-transporting ATPase subunit D
MRRFITLIKETHEIRSQVNRSIKIFSTQAGLSVAGYPYDMIKNMFLVKETLITADINQKNWMGVSVVDVKYEVLEAKPSAALISNPLLSKTEHDMRELLPSLLKLTVAEKNCYILSKEIETLRRRVNALEHMIIPNLQRNIRSIRMKLSDGERDTITRLIKIKTLK